MREGLQRHPFLPINKRYCECNVAILCVWEIAKLYKNVNLGVAKKRYSEKPDLKGHAQIIQGKV